MFPKSLRLALTALLTGLVWLNCIAASTGPSLKTLSGKWVHPISQPGSKGTVLLFVAHDCPVSNQYAPEFNRIIAKYEPKGIKFFLVYVELDLKMAEAQKHFKDFGYKCTPLLDTDHKMVKFSGARVTPEAAVFDSRSKKIYIGRIDDLYYAIGQRRYEAKQHDLRDSLDALLSSKTIKTPKTTAFGCYIVQK